jgi:hypothetical protein
MEAEMGQPLADSCQWHDKAPGVYGGEVRSFQAIGQLLDLVATQVSTHISGTHALQTQIFYGALSRQQQTSPQLVAQSTILFGVDIGKIPRRNRCARSRASMSSLDQVNTHTISTLHRRFRK